MDKGTITVRCACGWETTGPEAAVVEATVEHGRRMHNMIPTRDEVLAMSATAPDHRDDPAPRSEPTR
jgi:predicted small metal-binding protein